MLQQIESQKQSVYNTNSYSRIKNWKITFNTAIDYNNFLKDQIIQTKIAKQEKIEANNNLVTILKIKTKGRLWTPTMENLLKKHNGVVEAIITQPKEHRRVNHAIKYNLEQVVNNKNQVGQVVQVEQELEQQTQQQINQHVQEEHKVEQVVEEDHQQEVQVQEVHTKKESSTQTEELITNPLIKYCEMIDQGKSFLDVVNSVNGIEDRLILLEKSYLLHKYEMYYGKQQVVNPDLVENPMNTNLGKCPRRYVSSPDNLFKLRNKKQIPSIIQAPFKSTHSMKTRTKKTQKNN